MKVLLDSNGYSLLMRGHGEGWGEYLFYPRSHAEGRGEQQGRFGYSLRRWAALRGPAVTGIVEEIGFLRVVNKRPPLHPFSSK